MSIIPNWCSNRLLVIGPRSWVENFREVVKETDEEKEAEALILSFNKIIPEPGHLEDGLIDWRNENWGTKWEPHQTECNDVALHHDNYEAPSIVEYTFDTAWSEPSPVFQHASTRWPKLKFVLSFDEPGMDFGGYVIYQNGESVSSMRGGSRSVSWHEQADYEIEEF